MALEQQNINNTQLLDVAMLLKLLANLRPDCGYGEVQGVHGLNLGGLFSSTLFYVSPFLLVEKHSPMLKALSSSMDGNPRAKSENV
jgi:hypothetical protein